MPRKSKLRGKLCAIGLLSLSICLISCARVPIKDSEICGDLGDQGASCFHTLNDQARDIPKAAWDKERFGQLCMDSEAYANWKEALLKLCSVSHVCTYEEKQTILKLGDRIEDFQAKRPEASQ